jgi:ABC-type branched-subunit amino acid transport system ATPase component
MEIAGLAAGYGGDPIVAEIDITVGAGEVVAVIGANGAGKSTLLKAITGALVPISGRVTVEGREITRLPAHRLARLGIGYVPQTRDVFDTMTVVENLEMGGYLLSAPERAARVTEVMNIFPQLNQMRGRRALKLSGGERKMVALARVLMLRPKVLVLDEPTAGLSPELSRAVLRQQVRTLADRGTAILLVEQKAFEALEVSDWAYVLVGGRVVIDGPGSVVARRPDIREVFLGGTAQS